MHACARARTHLHTHTQALLAHTWAFAHKGTVHANIIAHTYADETKYTYVLYKLHTVNINFALAMHACTRMCKHTHTMTYKVTHKITQTRNAPRSLQMTDSKPRRRTFSWKVTGIRRACSSACMPLYKWRSRRTLP